MNRYIEKELNKRYNEYRADSDSSRIKAIIDLVLQAYFSENVKTMPEKLDSEFRALAIRQIHLFVFIGHDSTSSTICYIIDHLATNQKILTRIRAKHNKIFEID